MSIMTKDFDECADEIHAKYGQYKRRAFLHAGIDLTPIDLEYSELIEERVRWNNLELMQSCFGLGWDGEGYGHCKGCE